MSKRLMIILFLVMALAFAQVTKAQMQHSITLHWVAPVAGAASYNVYRSTVSGTGYTKLGNCLTTTLVDNTGVGGTKYFYVVRAVSSTGTESINSNETTATAILDPPVQQPCTGLTAVSN